MQTSEPASQRAREPGFTASLDWLAVEVFCETNVEPRTPGPETKGGMNRRNLVERLAGEGQELRTYVGRLGKAPPLVGTGVVGPRSA